MSFENYGISLKLMLDTAGPSLIIKKPSKAIVFENEILELKGITKESISSCGKIPLIFRDLTLYFYLVPEDFAIEEDGLIGSEMLIKYEAKINYEENFLEIASHVLTLRYMSSVNIARPINKKSVNLAQAEQCTETLGTMWRDDRNSRHARSLNETTRAEKSSVVLGECSTQNFYSVLPASHENVIPNKCLLNSTIVNPSEINIDFDSSKNSLKIENFENKNLNFKLVGSKNLKKEICNYKILNQNLNKSKDLKVQNCKYRNQLNKIKIGNCKW